MFFGTVRFAGSRIPYAKTVFSLFEPVHCADLEGQLRVCAVKGGAFQWVQVR